jgi:uroporphyrin-III C-methyltransferase
MSGKVYLVGAGPGDPELLTLKAARLLRSADAVLHDDLVSTEILQLVSTKAVVTNVGKRCGTKAIRQEEINFLMVNLALAGLQVARLKSGDPLLFGRGGEEIEALRKAGVDYEVVPGVTSALGAAAIAEIPLTDRRASSAVVFVTGHQAPGKNDSDWTTLVNSGATLVVYMPGAKYGEVAERLKLAGLTGETPCAIISRATTPEQKVHRTTVRELIAAPKLPAPTLLVVGQVVHFGAAGVRDLYQVLPDDWKQAEERRAQLRD